MTLRRRLSNFWEGHAPETIVGGCVLMMIVIITGVAIFYPGNSGGDFWMGWVMRH